MSIFSSFQNIQWREPLWLLLTLQPLLIYMFKRFHQQSNLSLFADKNLHAWLVYPAHVSGKNIFSYIFNKSTAYLLAWLLFAVALAGPRVQQANNELIAQGANIMLVVDISRSMHSTDIMPSRIRRAKIEIYELLEKAQGHRVGITVFAARAHLFVPLTTDHKALKSYVEMLDDLRLPTLGSNPVNAILLAQKKLKKITGPAAIVLLTDGDISAQNLLKNKGKLSVIKKENIPLYILGLGTVEGEAVQLDDGSWLKHNGNAVVSKMKEKSLSALAREFSGRYSPAYENEADWNDLYDQGIKNIISSAGGETHANSQYKELFAYALLPSLILFMIALSPYNINISKRLLPFIVIYVFFTFPGNQAFAFELIKTTEQQAFDAYTRGDFIRSEKYFKDVPGYNGYLGQANSLYKRGHYQSSIPKFSQAVLHARSDKQRAIALFNLANAHFRTGHFSNAIDTYHDVLRYSPNHPASLYNINISQVLKKNIELRIKEEQEILTAIRQGRGPRSRESGQNEAVNENTSVSLGSGTNKLDSKIPLPDLPGVSDDMVNKLIISGLENIKLAENNTLSFNRNKRHDISAINSFEITQQVKVLAGSKHLLWKRIFEIEEGFPAPVEKAKPLPGVNPW